jgi:hypothetical protein
MGGLRGLMALERLRPRHHPDARCPVNNETRVGVPFRLTIGLAGAR